METLYLTIVEALRVRVSQISAIWANPRLRHTAWLSLTILGFFVFALGLWASRLPSPFASPPTLSCNCGPFGLDAFSYYGAHGGADAYAGIVNTSGAGLYRYAPLWLPLLAPFGHLPFYTFAYLVAALELASLFYLTRRWFFAAFLFWPVFLELYEANIYLLMGALIVFALRHSGDSRERFPRSALVYVALAFTKVTTASLIFWHVFRREWGAVIVALAATGAILAAGLIYDPATWWAWLHSLANTAPVADYAPLGLPLFARLPVAVGLLALGARFRWPALVVVAAFLSLPAIWWHSYSLLIAIPAAAGACQRKREIWHAGSVSAGTADPAVLVKPAESPA